MKKILIILSLIICLTTLSACDDVQWFVRDTRVKSVAAEDLQKDRYYVKQNTRFWPVCIDRVGVNLSTTERLSKTRVIPLTPKAEASVPDCFRGEGLAFASDRTLDRNVFLERYKSIGHSIGAFNGTFDEAGYLCYTYGENCIVPGSSLAKILADAKSEYIRIESINNEKITPAQVDTDCGVINVLEEDKEYTIQMYVGTEYIDTKVIADTHMLKSFELFLYEDDKGMDFSSNSYLYFPMPDDLKTGYYQINGGGVFKYYDVERGKEDENADTTVPYYGSDKDQLISFSRQFVLNMPNTTKDLSIKIPFDSGSESIWQDIAGYVFAPDGTEYEMKIESEKDDDYLALNIAEAIAGEWTINVIPKDLTILDVNVESSKIDETASESVEEFDLENALENVTFSVDTTGEGEVYGYLLSPDGRTYDMRYEYDGNSNTGKLSFSLAYAKEGKWVVKVYYHPITNTISEIQMDQMTETETDTIIVED